MNKKRNRSKKKGFVRPDDPFWNPDDEEDYRSAYGHEEDEEPNALPTINETFLQAFIDKYQPEEDERLDYVRAFSMGELRDALQIYRTFDCKSPDPLPYYLNRLASDGFKVRIGCSGELVILVSRRGGMPGAIQIDNM